jgi:cell division septation protein DedD
LAQDDYYYEIQLTNKQLVFYFMAAAAGLIMSFLAGVAVGRGVDASVADARASKVVASERIVPEETASSRPAPATEDLSYAQRLESESVDTGLERPTPRGRAAVPEKATEKTPPPVKDKPTPAPRRAAAPPPQKPSPKPSPSPRVAAREQAPAAGVASFTIQVGAFKDKATADSVAARLKGKGFPAYVVTPDATDSGLYNVRVGSYPSRPDAEKIETRLRDEERYKPFIVKN